MSRTKSYATIKSNAETVGLTDVVASQSDHAAAIEEVPIADSEHEEAEDLVAALEASARRGEGRDYTPQEYSIALSDEILKGIRREGARSRLTTTRKALRYNHTEIAHVMAPVVKQALSGVAVHATFAKVAQAPDQDERPLVLIRQTGPTEHLTSGAIGGAVELFFYRTNVHVPLSASVIQAAADVIGVVGEAVGYVNSDDQSGIDRLRFTVHAAAPESPVIATVEPRQHDALARMLATELADACRYSTSRMNADYATGLVESSHLIVVPFGTVVESEDTANGRRQLTLTANLAVKVKVEPVEPTLGEVVATLLEQYGRGVFVPGLGVVESLKSIPTSDGTQAAAVEVVRVATGAGTDSSRIGFEGIHSFTVRAVLGSATRASAA